MMTRWLAQWFDTSDDGKDAAQGLGDGHETEVESSVWHLVDSSGALVAELARARRYERDFSVVVVSQNPWHEARNGQRNGTSGATSHETEPPRPMSLHTAAAGLREALRESDVLCYDPAHECFVLGLTESDTEAARRAVKRVRMLFSSRLHVDLTVGVAQFPDDRLTLGDLIATARARAAAAAGLSGVGTSDPMRDD